MARWHFWGEKQFAEVYENIYIRALTEDWFKIIFGIVNEISKERKKTGVILDIGCGEGHTTKQILDRLDNYTCDLLEPDKTALVFAESFLTPENKVRNFFPRTLSTFNTDEKYDFIFTSHTNYYWALNEKDYQAQLRKLVSLLKKDGKLLILTLPKDSDHYQIALRQVYPSFNYSEYITNFYKKEGLKVNVKRFKMRMYVGDILSTKSKYDLKNYYRFIHNTDSYPSEKEAHQFLEKIKKHEKNKYLDFRDELITITK